MYSEYQPQNVRSWGQDQINAILDVAQENLQRCIDDMKLPCTLLRKSRAVGEFYLFIYFITFF